jgi:hypothetical protein
MKRGMQTYFFSGFLCFQEQSHSHIKKNSKTQDPEKNSSRGKKCNGSGSATLVLSEPSLIFIKGITYQNDGARKVQ